MATLLYRSAELFRIKRWIGRYIHRRDAITAKKKAKKDALFKQRIKIVEELKAAAEAEERALEEKFYPPPFDRSKELYPPMWKPIKESLEFKYGLIDVYVDWDPVQNCDCVLGEPDTYTLHHKHINIFLQHILETRGYVVDYPVPECVRKPIPPSDLVSLERENPQCYTRYLEIAQAAFEEMNFHAKINGESYAFDELKKVVSAVLSHQVLLLTFTVKQLSPTVDVVKTVQAMEFARGKTYLIQWRFKPEASAADCST